MPINPNLLASVPDTIVMPVMVGFLLSLRSRHPKLDTQSWLVALSFLFLAQAVWIVHLPVSLQLSLALIGQLLAGLAFACYRGSATSYRRFDLLYLVVNAVPLLALVSLYAVGVATVAPYLLTLGLSLFLLVTTTFWREQDVYRAAWAAVILLSMMIVVSFGLPGATVFGLLAVIYGYGAYNFSQRLPHKSVGRVAILCGMAVLAVYYASHPWFASHSELQVLADGIGKMQKFFISVGMLLVLVENQSARHQYLSMHDQLTGVPNRRMLDGSLKAEIEWAQGSTGRLTLVMVDLNGFKQVNDTYGHLAGDHVLHEVAKRLRGQLRATELVARMGGDEFVVVTRAAVTEDQVKSLEIAMRKWIREPIDWEGKRLWIDGSMGSARFPEDVARWSDDVVRESSEKLAGAMLRIADMRMYAQKPSSKAGLAELEALFPTRSLLN